MSLRNGQAIQRDGISIVQMYTDEIGPELAAKRVRIHQSVIAFYEMRGGHIAGGIQAAPGAWLRALPRLAALRGARASCPASLPHPLLSPRPRLMRLSIIIVNWNVRELLAQAIESVYRHISIPAAEWELIVVDNASQDGSVEMMRERFPKAKLIASPENLGFGRANNVAWRETTGEFVLLLNPDTLVENNAIG